MLVILPGVSLLNGFKCVHSLCLSLSLVYSSYLTVVFVSQIGSHRYVLLLCSVLRTLFIPLFLLCNYDKDNAIPVVFNNDAYPVIFVSLFGLSNGYISTMAMMSAPRSVILAKFVVVVVCVCVCVIIHHLFLGRSLPSNMRETASTIMVFFISSGLLFGSIISFVWTKVVLQI